jgi:hypothetical protein
VANSPHHSPIVALSEQIPLRRPIVGIPAFGLLAGMVFSILAILMMILTGALKRTPIGLMVHLLKPSAAAAKPDAWTGPVVVLVKDGGPGEVPVLYVNSKAVVWDDLASALKRELSGRPEWLYM